MNQMPWYETVNINEYDSPALLFYPSRVKENIDKLVERVDARLIRTHVKTNKTGEVCALMMEAGIKKFKAATIAEAEMLAMIKAPDVLLAYPPTVLKIKRLIRLIQKYPDTQFSCLVDNENTAVGLSDLFTSANLTARVYIDLNLGMNRTGVRPENAITLIEKLHSIPALNILGLHAYDGHIKDRDINIRTKDCLRAFEPVSKLKHALEEIVGHTTTLIAGGSPTCFIHAAAGNRECSPGTFVFWDKGYSENLPEQPFDWAALIVSRIVSIPATDMICIDLGYKSVASENPLPRVYFINAPEAIPTAHSEEHLVLKVPDSAKFNLGDILYGVPWHICPTVALYDKALIVENNTIVDSWEIIARRREITI
ncbi:MAG TPA: D-TA family PLP-dependent enzyme [Puia sp.]|nr:D-TA family PLP-dependent enzyme [Puia sp.]